jgi:nicotinate dehydrogenase subunit A
MKQSFELKLNGLGVAIYAEDDGKLLWALRGRQGLTGVKYGCGLGVCDACTVLVDGQAVRSCLTTLASVAGRSVTTVEGLAKTGKLDPVQQAFVDHDAFQCGFCTPGMVLAAHALLRTNPRPSRDEIVAHMDRQLCRCGAQLRLVDAVEDASRRLGGRS